MEHALSFWHRGVRINSRDQVSLIGTIMSTSVLGVHVPGRSLPPEHVHGFICTTRLIAI